MLKPLYFGCLYHVKNHCKLIFWMLETSRNLPFDGFWGLDMTRNLPFEGAQLDAPWARHRFGGAVVQVFTAQGADLS